MENHRLMEVNGGNRVELRVRPDGSDLMLQHLNEELLEMQIPPPVMVLFGQTKSKV